MTSQRESLCMSEHTPLYEKLTKRKENDIVETTLTPIQNRSRPVFLGQIHSD